MEEEEEDWLIFRLKALFVGLAWAQVTTKGKDWKNIIITICQMQSGEDWIRGGGGEDTDSLITTTTVCLPLCLPAADGDDDDEEDY